MRGLVSAAFLFALAVPAAGGIVASTERGVVVAHDGVVELFDHDARRLFSTPGVEQATGIVAGAGNVAILDAWANRVRLVALADGSGRTIATGETPVGGVFVGSDFHVLERDSRSVARLDAAGRSSVTVVGADPAFIRQASGRIYVYSRLEGLLQEIRPRGGIVRSAAVGQFAADMAVHGETAYLIFPRDARLVTVDLHKLEVRRSVQAGGAPAGVAVVRPGGALSAPQIAVADPAAKRVWITEGAQSFGAAFGRGFIRGLIGAGVFRVRSEEFPTGVDRVVSANGVTLAFDSATGTLYRVGRRKTVVIGEGLEPQSFALAGGRVAIWSGSALRLVD